MLSLVNGNITALLGKKSYEKLNLVFCAIKRQEGSGKIETL